MRIRFINLAAACLMLMVCALSAYGVTSAWLSENYDIWSTIDLDVGQATVGKLKVFRRAEASSSTEYTEITSGTDNAGPYTMLQFDNTGLTANTANNYLDLILAIELTDFPGNEITVTFKGTSPTKNGQKLITNIISVACAAQSGSFDDAVTQSRLSAFYNSVKESGSTVQSTVFSAARTPSAAAPTARLTVSRSDPSSTTVVLLMMIDYDESRIELEYPPLENYVGSNYGGAVDYLNNLKTISIESAA